MNVPSFSLRPGQIVGVREKSKSLEAITESLAARTATAKRFNWLEWDSSLLIGKFVQYPERDQIPENVNEQAIVELYSK